MTWLNQFYSDSVAIPLSLCILAVMSVLSWRKQGRQIIMALTLFLYARYLVLKAYAKEFGREAMTLGHSATAKLMGYAWSGNVRELQGVMQRAVAMALGERLEAQDFDVPENTRPESAEPPRTFLSSGLMSSEGSFQEMKEKVIEEFERTFLGALLSTHHGNISCAARSVKKERRAFQRLLQKHGLDRRVFSAA